MGSQMAAMEEPPPQSVALIDQAIAELVPNWVMPEGPGSPRRGQTQLHDPAPHYHLGLGAIPSATSERTPLPGEGEFLLCRSPLPGEGEFLLRRTPLPGEGEFLLGRPISKAPSGPKHCHRRGRPDRARPAGHSVAPPDHSQSGHHSISLPVHAQSGRPSISRRGYSQSGRHSISRRAKAEASRPVVSPHPDASTVPYPIWLWKEHKGVVLTKGQV